MKGNILGC